MKNLSYLKHGTYLILKKEYPQSDNFNISFLYNGNVYRNPAVWVPASLIFTKGYSWFSSILASITGSYE